MYEGYAFEGYEVCPHLPHRYYDLSTQSEIIQYVLTHEESTSLLRYHNRTGASKQLCLAGVNWIKENYSLDVLGRIVYP